MITNARSEYGILRWVMHDLREHPDFDLQLVVSGPHMMSSMGETYRQIEEDGFVVMILQIHDLPVQETRNECHVKALGVLFISLIFIGLQTQLEQLPDAP